MKKVYSKPEIIFEDFALSTNIAGNCYVKIDTQASGTCGLPATGLGTVFISKLTGCTFHVADNGSYNGLCYHVPTETSDLFNS